jgi:ComF family protein
VTCARAAGAYVGALRSVIHALKYDGRRSLAASLAVLMRTRAADVLRDAACVVPVPLHPWRRVRRGFNQAADLAAGLGPPVVTALWRVRATAQQTGLSARARRSNMRGSVRLSPILSERARRLLVGQVVVLVDDVRTTGATLDECAAALRAAGAKEVRAVTAAMARLDAG